MEIIEKKTQTKTNPTANELGTSFILKECAATVTVHVLHLWLVGYKSYEKVWPLDEKYSEWKSKARLDQRLEGLHFM